MGSFQTLRLLVAAKRHPSAWLLLVQLVGVLLYATLEGTPEGRAAFGAFGIIVLVLALWVVNRSAAINWIAWCLAVPSVLLSGDHAKVDRWRRDQSLLRTAERRPELLAALEQDGQLSARDREVLPGE